MMEIVPKNPWDDPDKVDLATDGSPDPDHARDPEEASTRASRSIRSRLRDMRFPPDLKGPSHLLPNCPPDVSQELWRQLLVYSDPHLPEHRSLASYCRKYGVDHHSAEDLIQDAILDTKRLITILDPYRGLGGFVMYRLKHHLWDHLKRVAGPHVSPEEEEEKGERDEAGAKTQKRYPGKVVSLDEAEWHEPSVEPEADSGFRTSCLCSFQAFDHLRPREQDILTVAYPQLDLVWTEGDPVGLEGEDDRISRVEELLDTNYGNARQRLYQARWRFLNRWEALMGTCRGYCVFFVALKRGEV